jgi:hypothetical protein
VKRIFSTLSLSALLLVGCFDQGESLVSSNQGDQCQPYVTSKTVLSDPDLDPYTPANMSKALNALLAEKAARSGGTQASETYELKANYLYVKFLANGKRGVAALKQHDTDLVLFDHPLDYKPLPERIVYKDPTLPDSIIPPVRVRTSWVHLRFDSACGHQGIVPDRTFR